MTHLKKLRPDIEIVDQQWPKLGETDYTPFINAQMSKKPDAVFSSLWGGHFVTFAKQAKPLKYFESFGSNFLGAGEAGAIETAKAAGDDYPLGITANAYDAFNWADGPQAHKDYIARLKTFIKEDPPSSWPITGYMGLQILTAAIAKAGLDRQRQGLGGDEGPQGRYPDRHADDPRKGSTGQSRTVLGKDDQGRKARLCGDEPADLHRSAAFHGLTDANARWKAKREDAG